MMENKIDRPVLVFATPRSGSGPISRIIAAYLDSLNGIKNLGEFFCLWDRSCWDDGQGIRWAHFPQNVIYGGLNADLKNAVLGRRMRMLNKYHGRYFFKLMAGQLSGDFLNDLMGHYRWIFVERKNLFEQFLSYLISRQLDLWYLPGGLHPEELSLEPPREFFTEFENFYWKYLTLKKALRPASVIQYESFLINPSVESVLTKAGFHDETPTLNVKLPERQNHGDKLRYFREARVITDFYRNSFLNEVSPLQEVPI